MATSNVLRNVRSNARMVACEGARVALLSCPICGACLKLDPGDDTDPLQLHVEHHEREQAIRARALREPSPPLFRVGQTVTILRGKHTDDHGRIVDYWEEPGPMHCYTVRLPGRLLRDYVQDEIELLAPSAG